MAVAREGSPEPGSPRASAGAGCHKPSQEGGGVLSEALHGLADEHGLVTADSLRGFEGAAAALEENIGPGPWKLADLEDLLGAFFASGGQGTAATDAPATITDGPACPLGPASWPSSPSNPASPGKGGCGWRTVELQRLQDAVDSGLRAHEVSALLLDEPEGECPTSPQAAEDDGIGEVQRSVMCRIVAPIVEGSSPAGEERALRQLPAFVEELMGVLRKSWQLARIRGRDLERLTEELAAARAEARAASDRASREEAARLAAECEAGQGERAHELLEGTMSKLTEARRFAREKESELADSRHRGEQLEHDLDQQLRKARQLEAMLQRESAARAEAERRIAEARSEGDSEAAEQRGQLRRRLTAAEQELERAQEDLRASELRGEELGARAWKRRAEARELEAKLEESQRRVELLEHRLEEAKMQAKSGADASEEAGGGELGLPLATSSGMDTPAEPRDPRQTDRRLSDELRAEPPQQPRQPKEQGHQRREKRPVQTASQGAMPGDLRALGQLLSGGAVDARRRRAGLPPAPAAAGARKAPPGCQPRADSAAAAAVGSLVAALRARGGGQRAQPPPAKPAAAAPGPDSDRPQAAAAGAAAEGAGPASPPAPVSRPAGAACAPEKPKPKK